MDLGKMESGKESSFFFWAPFCFPFFLEICNLSMALFFFSSEILEIVLFFGSMRLLQFTRRPCTPRAKPSFHLHLKNNKIQGD